MSDSVLDIIEAALLLALDPGDQSGIVGAAAGTLGEGQVRSLFLAPYNATGDVAQTIQRFAGRTPGAYLSTPLATTRMGTAGGANIRVACMEYAVQIVGAWDDASGFEARKHRAYWFHQRVHQMLWARRIALPGFPGKAVIEFSEISTTQLVDDETLLLFGLSATMTINNIAYNTPE